jgi:uncharacterized membrane protein YhaH (DUF805 family)
MIRAYVRGVRKYVDFSGQSSRADTLGFLVIHLILAAVMGIMDAALGLSHDAAGVSPLFTIYMLGSLTPTLGVVVRRFHDIGKSAWWGWTFLLPIVGPVVFFGLLVRSGHYGGNQIRDNT